MTVYLFTNIHVIRLMTAKIISLLHEIKGGREGGRGGG
jgi:hypothetical protein